MNWYLYFYEKTLFLGNIIYLKYTFPDVNMVDLLSVFDFNLSVFLGPAFLFGLLISAF